MPCPHNEISIVQRSQQQSAVAAAAYQSGEKLFCGYDQEVKHYPEKRGIVHNEILLPANAPRSYADRNTLWNAAEAVEKQWNSQLARRWVLTIPREIPPDQYAALVRDFCNQQFVSKGMCVDFAIHDKGDGNPHAHVMLTMRAMATILMHYIKNGAEKDSYLDLVRRSTLDFDERCEEMFSSWGRALNYLKSRDLADLSDLIENDLIEPEYAGYVPADNPCCPGERCCEYAERMEREYAAEREVDEDNEDADVFEYDGEPAISELTGVCRDILTAVEGLTTLLRDEFDYAG